MRTYIEGLIAKYYSRGIIIDTNLLILFITGLYDENYIELFPRTASYSIEDFKIVLGLIRRFKYIVVTPHILAELSNLTNKMEESRLKGYFDCAIKYLSNADEKYIPKDLMLKDVFLWKIGFTDLSILESSKDEKILVLTDDLKLTNFLKAKKCDFINLNYIRTELWLTKI